MVNGSEHAPNGLCYDAELVFGGPDSGYSSIAMSSDVDLSLKIANNGVMQAIPYAYDFGSDTAESISNVQLQSLTTDGVSYMEMTESFEFPWFFSGFAVIGIVSVPLFIRLGKYKHFPS